MRSPVLFILLLTPTTDKLKPLPTVGTVEYEYDSWNRLHEVIEGDEKTVYHYYDDNGNLIERKPKDGATVNYTWDD